MDHFDRFLCAADCTFVPSPLMSLKTNSRSQYSIIPSCESGMALSQKASECNNRVIEAATHLFARHGYRGTSTREIARLAEISENTLFRHFEHKEDIFWSTLAANLNGLRVRKE